MRKQSAKVTGRPARTKVDAQLGGDCCVKLFLTTPLVTPHVAVEILETSLSVSPVKAVRDGQRKVLPLRSAAKQLYMEARRLEALVHCDVERRAVVGLGLPRRQPGVELQGERLHSQALTAQIPVDCFTGVEAKS